MMSKAKWFVVRKPSTGEIIATSANQIVPPKFRGPTKMLSPDPPSSCSVKVGSGDETRVWGELYYVLSRRVRGHAPQEKLASHKSPCTCDP